MEEEDDDEDEDDEVPTRRGLRARVADAVLAPMRALSFWRMKDRARVVGEVGAAGLLADLRRAAPNARVHAMGHSFGCVAMASMVARSDQAVDSLMLVQAAMSSWSFCRSIPHAWGAAGYFHPIVRDGLVRGPIVATRTPHDLALGRWYPLAAGWDGQVTFASGEAPRHGAIGRHGIAGLGRARSTPPSCPPTACTRSRPAASPTSIAGP